MAKKDEQKQPETTEELIPEETVEAPQEEPKAAEAEKPETDPFEEKYNAEHDSLLRLAAEYDNFRKRRSLPFSPPVSERPPRSI